MFKNVLFLLKKL